MWMAEGVSVACLNHRPPRSHTPEKRDRTAPPAPMVRDFKQIGLENYPGIEERCLGFLLDIAGEEDTERLIVDAEDEGVVINYS